MVLRDREDEEAVIAAAAFGKEDGGGGGGGGVGGEVDGPLRFPPFLASFFRKRSETEHPL